MSDPDEPKLWQKDLTGRIVQWIEVGQPEERRIAKAGGRADRSACSPSAPRHASWSAGLGGRIARAGNVGPGASRPSRAESSPAWRAAACSSRSTGRTARSSCPTAQRRCRSVRSEWTVDERRGRRGGDRAAARARLLVRRARQRRVRHAAQAGSSRMPRSIAASPSDSARRSSRRCAANSTPGQRRRSGALARILRARSVHAQRLRGDRRAFAGERRRWRRRARSSARARTSRCRPLMRASPPCRSSMRRPGDAGRGDSPLHPARRRWRRAGVDARLCASDRAVIERSPLPAPKPVLAADRRPRNSLVATPGTDFGRPGARRSVATRIVRTGVVMVAHAVEVAVAVTAILDPIVVVVAVVAVGDAVAVAIARRGGVAVAKPRSQLPRVRIQRSPCWTQVGLLSRSPAVAHPATRHPLVAVMAIVP